MKTFTIGENEFQLVQDIQTEPYKVKRFLVKKKNNNRLVSELCDLIIKFLLITIIILLLGCYLVFGVLLCGTHYML